MTKRPGSGTAPFVLVASTWHDRFDKRGQKAIVLDAAIEPLQACTESCGTAIIYLQNLSPTSIIKSVIHKSAMLLQFVLLPLEFTVNGGAIHCTGHPSFEQGVQVVSFVPCLIPGRLVRLPG